MDGSREEAEEAQGEEEMMDRRLAIAIRGTFYYEWHRLGKAWRRLGMSIWFELKPVFDGIESILKRFKR